jgi:hypothetical protein
MSHTEKSHPADSTVRDYAPPGLMGATYIGPTLLLSLALLSLILVGSSSPQYGFGYTVGKMATSFALALPIYFVTRYFTSFGRRLNRKGKMNALCLFIVVVWCLQLAALTLLPYFVANQVGNQQRAPRAANASSEADQSVPRLPNGAIDWSQFTPIEKGKCPAVTLFKTLLLTSLSIVSLS